MKLLHKISENTYIEFDEEDIQRYTSSGFGFLEWFCAAMFVIPILMAIVSVAIKHLF